MEFLNIEAFDASASASTTSTAPSQPLFVQDTDEEAITGQAGGVNFAELFRQYLAPEVAKLPSSFQLPPLPSTAPTAPSEEHPFALSASETEYSPADSFSPSAFAPINVPGSPIGGFSPSSSNDDVNRSPISFGELDFDTGADADMLFNGPTPDWSINPSFFGTSSASPPAPLVQAALAPSPLAAPPALAPLAELPHIVIKQEQHDIATIPEEDDEDQEMAGGSEDDSDSENERDTSPSSSSSRTRSTAPSKRKAKTPKTSVSAFASETLHPTSAKSTLPPVPEWADKPDPEAYKKLNSKEKRQLRNKISARNFRHRRKEYITTLEEEISSRDTIITQLRDEVGTMRVENKDLRSEVSTLKQKWDEMMEKMAAFSAPPSLVATPASVGLGMASSAAKLSSPSSPSSEEWALDSPKQMPQQLPSAASANVTAPAAAPIASSSRRAGTRGAAGIVKPNMSKDVAPTLKRSTGSWTTSGLGMGNGYMPVHTTFMPEFNMLNAKQSLSPFEQNFNPILNNLSAAQRAELPSVTSHLRAGLASSPHDASAPTAAKSTFESFFESNPLWLRADNIEEYRTQLYGKVAHNMAGAAAAQKAAGGATSPSGHLPLPVGFRPAFFTSPRAAPAALLSGKEHRDEVPPPSSDLLAFQSPRTNNLQQEVQRDRASALVAGIATQTLFSRMAGAFVDAFAGSTAEERKVGFSSAKVASILDGSATVQVVPRSRPVVANPPAAVASVDTLGLQLGSLDLSRVASPSTHSFNDACQRWMTGSDRPHTPTN